MLEICLHYKKGIKENVARLRHIEVPHLDIKELYNFTTNITIPNVNYKPSC